jgi:putative inorganic carbon (HCO3(-)) transporter
LVTILQKTRMFRSICVRLCSNEIYPVGLLIAASVAVPLLLPWAVGVAAFFWLIRLVSEGRLTHRTPADLPIVVLVLWIPVTLIATSLPEITRLQALRLLSGIALYYAIINWGGTEIRLRWLEIGLVCAGLILAILAPFSVAWSIGKLPIFPAWLYQNFKVLVSDTIHPNVMGGTLILLIPIPISTLLFSANRLSKIQRIFYLFACLSMLVILALTQSRGAWLALLVGLFLLVVLRFGIPVFFSSTGRPRWGWLMLILAGIGAGALVSALGYQTVLDDLIGSSAGVAQGGFAGRMEIWSRAIYMIQDFPFTGVGMGAFGPVADALYPFIQFAPGTLEHAHNLFLQVAVDLGLPGLVAFLAVLSIGLWGAGCLWRNGWREGRSWQAGLGAGLLGSQIALIIHGLTDAVTWGMVRPAPLVWAVWGLTIATWLWQTHTIREAPLAGTV